MNTKHRKQKMFYLGYHLSQKNMNKQTQTEKIRIKKTYEKTTLLTSVICNAACLFVCAEAMVATIACA